MCAVLRAINKPFLEVTLLSIAHHRMQVNAHRLNSREWLGFNPWEIFEHLLSANRFYSPPHKTMPSPHCHILKKIKPAGISCGFANNLINASQRAEKNLALQLKAPSRDSAHQYLEAQPQWSCPHTLGAQRVQSQPLQPHQKKCQPEGLLAPNAS